MPTTDRLAHPGPGRQALLCLVPARERPVPRALRAGDRGARLGRGRRSLGVRPGGRGREAVPVPHRRRRTRSPPASPCRQASSASASAGDPRPGAVAQLFVARALPGRLAGLPLAMDDWVHAPLGDVGAVDYESARVELGRYLAGLAEVGAIDLASLGAVEAEAREAGDTSRPGRACPAPGRTCRAELPTIPRPSHRRCGASSSAERRHVERSARSSARSRRKRGQRVIRGRARRAEVRFARAEPSGRSTRRCRTRSAARIAGDDSRRGRRPASRRAGDGAGPDLAQRPGELRDVVARGVQGEARAHHAAAPHHQALATGSSGTSSALSSGRPTLGFGGLLVLNSLFGAKRTRSTRRSLTG